MISWLKKFFKKRVIMQESKLPEIPTQQEVDNFPPKKLGLFPDISRYESCDFSKFDSKALITKATDGASWIDPTFFYNMSQCKVRNIKFGAYHFYRAGVDPIDQAKHFIRTFGLENIKSSFYPPIFDYETVTAEKVGLKQSEEEMKKDLPDAKIFLKYIQAQTGRKCLFYTYESLLNFLQLDKEFVDLCDGLWIARYGKKPSVFAPWTTPWAWQYSDGEYSNNPTFKDSFNGIGRCDANILWEEIP